MFIKTTYCMRNDVIALLREAAEKTRHSPAELIVKVMRKMLKNQKAYQRKYGRIEYQKRCDVETKTPIKKQRVKVKFLLREYEYFQDMRRIFRRSISLIMAIAILNYLDEVVKNILNNENKALLEDNYPFENYAIMEKCIDNITTFRIWWGLPANLKLLQTK